MWRSTSGPATITGNGGIDSYIFGNDEGHTGGTITITDWIGSDNFVVVGYGDNAAQDAINTAAVDSSGLTTTLSEGTTIIFQNVTDAAQIHNQSFPGGGAIPSHGSGIALGGAAQPKPRNPGISLIGRAAASFARSGTGRAVRLSPASIRSSSAATASTCASPPRRPTICRPNGIPFASSPTGTDTAGWPTRVTA